MTYPAQAENNFSKARYLIFLSMLYVAIAAVTSTFVYRFVSIGNLLLPGGIFIYPLMYVICDSIAEVYGYKIARMVIWYGVLCNFIFAISAEAIIYLPSPSNTNLSKDYLDVFSHLLRVDFSTLIATITGGFLNIYLISKWKILVKGKYFILRSFTSNVFGELIALLIAATLSLITIYPAHEIIKIILSDYAIRVIFAFIATIPSTWLVNYLKNKEKIDTYSIGVNFNPFKLNIDN